MTELVRDLSFDEIGFVSGAGAPEKKPEKEKDDGGTIRQAGNGGSNPGGGFSGSVGSGQITVSCCSAPIPFIDLHIDAFTVTYSEPAKQQSWHDWDSKAR